MVSCRRVQLPGVELLTIRTRSPFTNPATPPTPQLMPDPAAVVLLRVAGTDRLAFVEYMTVTVSGAPALAVMRTGARVTFGSVPPRFTE